MLAYNFTLFFTEPMLTAQGVPVFDCLARFLKKQDYLSDS